MSILIFLIILFVLVVSHEFGHFIVAKRSGIRVDEFSFGFPPKLFGKKFGETTYNFNALPLGGYVKIFGENPDEGSISGPDSSRSFVNKPKYVQAFVLSAGIFMNLLVAWILLSVGFISGLPSSVQNIPEGSVVKNQNLTVTSVMADSPADKAGLKIGDKILDLSTPNDSTPGTPSSLISPEMVQSFIKDHNQEEVEIRIIRAKENMSLVVVPEINNLTDTVMVGISMDTIGILKLPIHKAVWEGLKLTSDLTIVTVKGFYHLIKDALTGKGNMSSLTGPVGIVGVVGDASHFGFIYLLSFTALISINLAVLNLIPFPALDGGRLLFLLIEKIKGSRINSQISNVVNAIGFGLLMILMVLITYNDIVKLL